MADKQRPKAVILNGMAAGDDGMASIHEILVDVLEDKGWDVEPFTLHQMEITPCGGCFGCWVQTPGRCIMQGADKQRPIDDVVRAFVQSDLVIYLTPVTFGGYSSELKKAVDHLIPFILPFFQTVDGETHHKPRYEHSPNLLGVGVLPQADAESARIFTTLVARNAINMHAPASTAGVITREQTADAIRAEIQTLLASVDGGHLEEVAR
jgi:hypothetical protein